MLDPFPLPNPQWSQQLGRYIASYTGMQSLPDHLHEILFAAALYQLSMSYFSPKLARMFVPSQYNALSHKSRVNWDIHFVSFVQSTLVCVLAVWTMRREHEWSNMGWQERMYGYTGACGLVQAFVVGYFVWDLYVCLRYYSIFGFGMLVHAISALTVYSLGYKPFANWYGIPFILYELSSPFLNIHWFCDKLNWTGGSLQLINGIILLATFACCRLIWGAYSTYMLWADVYTMVMAARAHPNLPPLAQSIYALNATTSSLFTSPAAALEVVKYAPLKPNIPHWMWFADLASLTASNMLNFYWYGQMISAIRKRFPPPFGTKRDTGKAPAKEIDVQVSRSADASGRKVLEVDAVELRRRAAERAVSSDSLHAA